MTKFNPFKWLQIPDHQAQIFSDQILKDFHETAKLSIKTYPQLKGIFRVFIDEKSNVKFHIDETELIMYAIPTLGYKKLVQKNGQMVKSEGSWEGNKFRVRKLNFLD